MLAEADAKSLLKNFFSSLVSPGTFFRQQSVEILERWQAALEKRMKEIISGHHVYYWLHLYRRLAPENVFRYPNIGSVYILRNILESAFYKYGRLDAGSLDDDIISGENIDPGLIMNGEYLKSMKAHGLQLSGKCSGLYIRKFGFDRFVEILSLEGMASEYHRATAILRRVFKG